MRVAPTLRNFLKRAQGFCHASRAASVCWAVEALLAGGVLSCAGLGRSGVGGSCPKHKFKRADRLLGNQSLQMEVGEYSRILALTLVADTPRAFGLG